MFSGGVFEVSWGLDMFQKRGFDIKDVNLKGTMSALKHFAISKNILI